MSSLANSVVPVNVRPETFVEALPASRTHQHRGIRWTPCEPTARCACSGRLEILQGSKGRSTVYTLTLFPCDWNGTAARLDKADGSEHYSVYVAHDGQERRCDCAGFEYAAKERADSRHRNTAHRDTAECKHIDALLALLANGWISHASEGPDGGDWNN